MKYFDGHNDVLLKLHLEENINPVHEFYNGNNFCQIDYPKIIKSNFSGGFFAIFVPDSKPDNDFFNRMNKDRYDFPLPNQISSKFAYESTMNMIDILKDIENSSKNEIKICKSGKELDYCIKNNKVGIILHIEGAECIDKDFNSLDTLYNLGLRSIGIVWSRNNIFASGVPFSFPSSPDRGAGLTKIGLELVKLCDERNILLDLSHINQKGFYDVANTSTKPLIATHSNAHFITKHSRNLTDDQLNAIKSSNGIVGINFATAFLRKDGKMLEECALTNITDHLEHLLKILGEDRVAIGSDFDGAIVPKEIKDLSGIINLENYLFNQGYSKKLIEKIFYKNWLNFLVQNLI